jgi:hypothetical protein
MLKGGWGRERGRLMAGPSADAAPHARPPAVHSYPHNIVFDEDEIPVSRGPNCRPAELHGLHGARAGCTPRDRCHTGLLLGTQTQPESRVKPRMPTTGLCTQQLGGHCCAWCPDVRTLVVVAAPPPARQAGVVADDISREEYLNAPGEKYTVKLTTAGSYRYYCEPHQGAGMVGTVRKGLAGRVWGMRFLGVFWLWHKRYKGGGAGGWWPRLDCRAVAGAANDWVWALLRRSPGPPPNPIHLAMRADRCPVNGSLRRTCNFAGLGSDVGECGPVGMQDAAGRC